MKKYVALLLLMLLLTGCVKAETFETIADEPDTPVFAAQRSVTIDLPEDASVWTMEQEEATFYWCDGYELCLDILPAGNLDGTIQEISGYHQKNLTVLSTQNDDYTRHEFVWTSVEDQGDRVGRAAVLDDGNYHYILAVMTDADTASDYSEQWNSLFRSYGLR